MSDKDHAPTIEAVGWDCHASVDKWDDDAVAFAVKKKGLIRPTADDMARLKIAPYETVEGPTPGNVATTVGLTQLWLRLVTTAQVWSVGSAGSAFTGLAVQDGTTGETAADTDMQGTNKSYSECDDTYPTLSSAVATFKSSFQTGEANFAWNGYGVLIPGAGASALTGAAVTTKPTNYILLNHKVTGVSLGTKSSGLWTLTVTITLG